MRRSATNLTTLHEFGRELSALRMQAGAQAKDVAERLHISASKLSKIEHGRAAPTESDVRAILALFDVSLSKQEQLIRAHREIVLKRRFGPRKPSTYLVSTLEEIEDATSGARRVRTLCAQFIPWFVQTPRYIELYFERFNPDLSPNEVNRRLVSRLKRQAELFGHEREYEIVIFESAFRSSLTADAGYGDLAESVRRCSTLPNVDLRIVPASKKRGLLHDFSAYGSKIVTEVFNYAVITSEKDARNRANDEFTDIKSLSVSGEEALDIVERYADRPHPEIDVRQARSCH